MVIVIRLSLLLQVDVSGAYDSLPHSKLLEVVQNVLKPMEEKWFSLRHYAKVCTNAEQEIRKHFCTKVHIHTLSPQCHVVVLSGI